MDERITRARWMVRAIIGAMGIAAIATLVGCAETPTGPSQPPSPRAGVIMRAGYAVAASELSTVAEHGRTVGTPDGGIMWLCRTQPRMYTSVEGQVETVIDWYVEPSPCPETPIE